jgi:AcrR family transcriptional regulator
MPIQVARKKRDSYQHGGLREALVQAGLKLLAESGVEGLSLRAAAQLAGVSHAAPYRHFRDKRALVAAIAERGFRMLTTSMRAEVGPMTTSDARERLIALGVGYLKFATASPGYLHVIFGGVLAGEHVPRSLAEAGAEAYETLRAEVAAGIEHGELRAGDPDVQALACWSMVHGLSMLIINGALPAATGKAQRQLIEELLRLLGVGLYAPGAEARPTAGRPPPS